MQTCEVEVFSGAVNAAVIRFPGRKFPGMLIQGDTLSTLYALARRTLELARARAVENGIVDVTEQLVADLGSLLKEYEQVLIQHNIGLPYVSPFP